MNEIISAYEQGVDDGFFRGIENDPHVMKHAMNGVWMHCVITSVDE
jgi:hypothetical protein